VLVQTDTYETENFRLLCEQVLVPLLTTAFERQVLDIHDMLDIASNELIRIGERLDEIDAHICRATDADE
jgi:hypothetical protein